MRCGKKEEKGCRNLQTVITLFKNMHLAIENGLTLNLVLQIENLDWEAIMNKFKSEWYPTCGEFPMFSMTNFVFETIPLLIFWPLKPCGNTVHPLGLPPFVQWFMQLWFTCQCFQLSLLYTHPLAHFHHHKCYLLVFGPAVELNNKWPNFSMLLFFFKAFHVSILVRKLTILGK